MTNRHRPRGRISLRPLGTDPLLKLSLEHLALPRGAVAIAEYWTPSRADFGWLIELPSKRLAVWFLRRGLGSIDERKARAALDYMARWQEEHGTATETN